MANVELFFKILKINYIHYNYVAYFIQIWY